MGELRNGWCVGALAPLRQAAVSPGLGWRTSVGGCLCVSPCTLMASVKKGGTWPPSAQPSHKREPAHHGASATPSLCTSQSRGKARPVFTLSVHLPEPGEGPSRVHLCTESTMQFLTENILVSQPLDWTWDWRRHTSPCRFWRANVFKNLPKNHRNQNITVRLLPASLPPSSSACLR